MNIQQVVFVNKGVVETTTNITVHSSKFSVMQPSRTSLTEHKYQPIPFKLTNELMPLARWTSLQINQLYVFICYIFMLASYWCSLLELIPSGRCDRQLDFTCPCRWGSKNKITAKFEEEKINLNSTQDHEIVLILQQKKDLSSTYYPKFEEH